PLTVSYATAGTATSGTDYIALSGSVTIPAGSSSAAIAVTPVDDALVEPNESIIVTVTSDSAYVIGAPGSAVVAIVSDDVPSDLVVRSVTAPALAGAGATITVSDTTANQGSGSATASTTGLYLSNNVLLDSKDP